ncbi:MAG: ParA family protein [Bdellovibrionota bacterium]
MEIWFFETVIKTNVALAEAPSNGQTIFEYAPKERGADDYRDLANEVDSDNNNN